MLREKSGHVIELDLSSFYRMATSVARYLEGQGREFASQSYHIFPILAGLNEGSGVHADLLRGRIVCHWIGDSQSRDPGTGSSSPTEKLRLAAFSSLKEALQWIKLLGAGT